jgi:hypothetical protein
MKALKNPYILLGLLGLAYFWYQRKNIIKANPKAKKPLDEIEEEAQVEPDMRTIGKKFVEDVRNMDNKTLQRTIATNKKMLKRTRLPIEEKESIENMIDYLNEEYDYRLSGR